MKQVSKRKAVSVDARKVNWDGVAVPIGVVRDRIEVIDAALQQVRRRDDGTIKLPSAKDFAAELGIGEKTVRETIQEMQDLYDLPVRYNAKRFGYEYTEDVVFSPWLQLSESELVAVYLAQQLGAFQGTQFRTRLQSAFRKLTGVFGKALSFNAELLDECFSFEPSGHYAAFQPAHLEACSQAMLMQEEIRMTYTKQHGEGAGAPEVRRVQPLHITYRDFAWYVLCHDLQRKGVRLFMVTRINAMELTGVRFERAPDFNAREYLDKAFKVFASGEAETVVLEFSAKAAARVMERRWHATQEFSKLEDGRVRMRMTVPLSPDLQTWVGGFFGDCRVVEPESLRVEMARLFSEGLTQNGG